MSATIHKLRNFTLLILFVWLMVIMAVDLSSPAPNYSDSLPDECGVNSQNCSGFGMWYHRSDEEDAVVFSGTQEEAMESIIEWVSSRDRMDILHANETTIHAVETSFVFRFKDDLVVHTECDDGLVLVHAYSSSRIGVGDMNVNPTRLSSLITHLQEVDLAGQGC